MANLDKAIAAEREALAEYDADQSSLNARHAAETGRDLLAALDAARGEAVATVHTITSLVGETRKVIIGKTEVIDALPVSTAVFAAAPAALAGPAWTEAQLREEAKARGWHVREGRSVPTPDGEWRHPFEVTIPSRDLCAMLAQQPAAAVPEGYALVPVDLRLANDVWEAGIASRNGGGSVADMWAAMLAAAERKGNDNG